MATSTRTRVSLVRDALRFYNEPEIWIGIGRYLTPWDGETDPNFVPPAPDITQTQLLEARAYKKVSQKYIVKPTLETTGNIITWRGSNYEIIDPVNALAEGAHWVYVRADFIEAELPQTTYRQIGVFTDLQKSGTAPAGAELLLVSSGHVTNPGYLELLENRKPIPHDFDTTEVIAYIREF